MIIGYLCFFFFMLGCMIGPWMLGVAHDFEKRWHERHLKKVKVLGPFRPWLNMETGRVENPYKVKT